MIEKYVSDDEYHRDYFLKLNDLRHKIASDLSIEPGMQILDLATGGGYFAVEISRTSQNINIKAIDISKSDIQNAQRTISKYALDNNVKVLRMDAINMSFPDENFDMVVNFLGLEDIHMTRGKKGVNKIFLEVNRVLKSSGKFCFTVMPPEEMETEAEKIEVELFSYICDATWLDVDEYEAMLESSGFKLIRKNPYFTGMKLTSEQAKEEIRFACDNVPKVYGITTQSFENTWKKFGKSIKKYGLGHYSKVILFIAQKIGSHINA